MGLAKGLRALKKRHQCCRPGYRLTTRSDTIGFILVDNTFLPNSELSENAARELESHMNRAHLRVNALGIDARNPR